MKARALYKLLGDMEVLLNQLRAAPAIPFPNDRIYYTTVSASLTDDVLERAMAMRRQLAADVLLDAEVVLKHET